MNQPCKNMSCAEFSSRMAQLIASGEDISAHPHVRGCSLHQALLEDLEAIAEAAKLRFPEVSPSESLWDEIRVKLAAQEPSPTVMQVAPGYRLMFTLRMAGGSTPDRISVGQKDMAGSNPVRALNLRSKRIEGLLPFSRREGRR